MSGDATGALNGHLLSYFFMLFRYRNFSSLCMLTRAVRFDSIYCLVSCKPNCPRVCVRARI